MSEIRQLLDSHMAASSSNYSGSSVAADADPELMSRVLHLRQLRNPSPNMLRLVQNFRQQQRPQQQQQRPRRPALAPFQPGPAPPIPLNRNVPPPPPAPYGARLPPTQYQEDFSGAPNRQRVPDGKSPNNI